MVELIPKKSKRAPFGNFFFLLISLLLVSGALMSFFIVRERQSEIKDNLQSLTTRIETLTTVHERKLEEDLLAVKEKLDDFTLLMEERTDYFAVFRLLEETTHPEVHLSEFRGSIQNNTITIKGVGSSFQILEQQRLVWENKNEIRNITLNNIGLGREGGADFAVELLLSPNLVIPYNVNGIDQ